MRETIENVTVAIVIVAIVVFSCWAALSCWVEFSEPASPSALERRVVDLEVELGEVSQEVVNLHQQINDLQACSKGCE